MGLKIHSLGELPIEAIRGYYVYLLDYGWHEPLGKALKDNFDKMSEMASKNDAVVMKGTDGCEFEDEVLSWHQINGLPSEEILPAILITNAHPRQFQSGTFRVNPQRQIVTENLILIPLRRVCNSTTEVAVLINKLFMDIQQKKALPDFDIAKQIKKGKGRSLVEALILQPNLYGVGVDLHKIRDFLKRG